MRKIIALVMFLSLTLAASAQFIYNPTPPPASMAKQMFENVQFIYNPTPNVGVVQSAPAPAPVQNANSNQNYQETKRDNLNRGYGETCHSCKGTGKCHACNGTKVAHSFGNSYTCNVCDSQGNCPVCHGTGKTAWNR